ncbi:hypothetical protein ACEWY4_004658 [Coilia grayii]|uniref:Interleukin-6 receptor subunit beta n=1 Tax=Coilia grayii TaxID=363190 RepID=A0ABD1KME2_9TELE
MARLLLLLPTLFLLRVHATSQDIPNCVLVKPNPPNDSGAPAELGKEFTATCLLRHPLKADNIVWAYNTGHRNVEFPRKYYKIINDTAGSITFNVTEDMRRFVTCSAHTASDTYTFTHNDCRYITYGILLDKGYPPQKPTALKCQSVQKDTKISNNVTCEWNPGTRDPRIQTEYTLCVEVVGQTCRHATNSSGTVVLEIFPHHEIVKIWVEAKNALGKVRSEPQEELADYLIKTNPPANVRIPEPAFPRSLLIQWNHSIDQSYVRLKYKIRFREKESATWLQVPEEDTKDYQDSFRLQFLKPYTEYVVQVCCKHEEDLGYWSDWSLSAIKRTAEDQPSSKPDIWMNSALDGSAFHVQLVLKKPVESNGKILAYDIMVVGNGEPKLVQLPFKGDEPFQVYEFTVQRHSVVFVEVTANNSVGVSPKADMAVPLTTPELPPVDGLVVFSQNNTFQVEWSAPQVEGPPTEYVLEWVSLLDGQRGWQREQRHTTKTHIRDNTLRPFVPYNVTVTPVYHRSYRDRSSLKVIHLRPPGKPQTVTLYLKEGVPVAVPVVQVERTWKHSAELFWSEIPLEKRQGFITNYTIVYESNGIVASQTVPPHEHSLVLNHLQKDGYYTIKLVASTVAGSKSSDAFNMRTSKYDPGEIEMIVVAVCFGFLFLTILTIRLCFKNRETLKKKFWPQVPDPYNSTVAKWSPDLSARAGSPKETTLGDLSVVEVDVFEQKSLCGDEDKASLAALKKDKYLSEEHSSGIGGSSCMSSPRQSVSDSDEADSGQTTASTVQYSSVVGYKGQTPGGASSSTTASNSSSSSSSSSSAGINGGTSGSQTPAHTFARSESTQPLLDSEEQQEGSGQNHAGRAGSLFRRHHHHHGLGDADGFGGDGTGGGGMRLHPSEQDEQDCGSLEFCPAEDATGAELPQHGAERPASDAHLSRPPYMPQQSGYRPQ